MFWCSDRSWRRCRRLVCWRRGRCRSRSTRPTSVRRRRPTPDVDFLAVETSTDGGLLASAVPQRESGSGVNWRWSSTPLPAPSSRSCSAIRHGGPSNLRRLLVGPLERPRGPVVAEVNHGVESGGASADDHDASRLARVDAGRDGGRPSVFRRHGEVFAAPGDLPQLLAERSCPGCPLLCPTASSNEGRNPPVVEVLRKCPALATSTPAPDGRPRRGPTRPSGRVSPGCSGLSATHAGVDSVAPAATAGRSAPSPSRVNDGVTVPARLVSRSASGVFPRILRGTPESHSIALRMCFNGLSNDESHHSRISSDLVDPLPERR